jgi:predicted RNA-binding protein (virulence factor B family)
MKAIKRKVGDTVHVWVYDDKQEHIATIEITHTEIRVYAPTHMNIKTARLKSRKRK